MKLPPDVTFNEQFRLVVWRPRGTIDESAVNQIIAFLGNQEATRNQPFNRFTDTLEAEATDLNFQYIFHISLFRRMSSMGRPPVKSAILVSSYLTAHYAKMHAMLTQGSPLRVKVFEDGAAAAKWLKVPPEALAPVIHSD